MKSDIVISTKNNQGTESRSPHWCVAFLSYRNTISYYTAKANTISMKPIKIASSDTVAVSYSGGKGSFPKMANISLKNSNPDFDYRREINPGDWVFVWMSTDIETIKTVEEKLANIQSAKGLNTWDSGFKFAGRVLTGSDGISVSSGVKSETINISAQAFIEFATSVYYTATASNVLSGKVGIKDEAIQDDVAANAFARNTANAIRSNKNVGRGDLANQIFDFFLAGEPTKTSAGAFRYWSPDMLIGMYFILVMGCDPDSLPKATADLIKGAFRGRKGIFSDAIDIPREVAIIFGRPKARKLWQIYNVYLGLQKYRHSNSRIGQTFQPTIEGATSVTDADNVIYRTPTRTKGWVLFRPAAWTNVSIWSIFSQHLNSVMNEMYTCFRVDGSGKIMPTLIVREKPFSTRLFDYISKAERGKDAAADLWNKLNNASDNGRQEETSSTQPQPAGTTENQKIAINEPDYVNRTMFNNLPTWEIDESAVTSINIGVSESNRINFVQVWGNNQLATYNQGQNGNESAIFQETQITQGNYASDEVDISRHGLRAMILESDADYPLQTMSVTKHWSKMVADWSFNGHLKASGSITMVGVKEPIVEGDNLLFKDVLFHIESVNHSCQISGGIKVFTTTVQLSNGILAKSLDNGIPRYINELPSKHFFNGITKYRS